MAHKYSICVDCKLRQLIGIFVKLTLVQLTLRRWVEISTAPGFYVLVFMFVLVGAVTGIYGSFNQFSFFERLLISAEINLICWIIGVAIVVPVRIWFMQRGVSGMVAVAIGCGVACAAILPTLYFILQFLIGLTFTLSNFLEHALMMSALVFLVAMMLRAHQPLQDNVFDNVNYPTPNDPENCPLQKRLSPEKRGVLFAMIAQDHYVEFVTDKGSELVLMRLSDAVEIANPRFGMKVHRSAWVSIFGMQEMQKQGRKFEIVLPNGRSVPVARNMRAKVVAFAKQFNDEVPVTGALPA